MDIEIINTGRSTLLRGRDNNGHVKQVHIPNYVKYAEAYAQITKTIENINNKNKIDYMPELRKTKNAEMLASSVIPQLRKVINDTKTDKRNALERLARLQEPLELQKADLVYEGRFIDQLEAMSLADRLRTLSGELTIEQTSALIRHDDLNRLCADETISNAVLDRHAILKGSVQIAGNHANLPSMADPFVIGPNMEAARADASAQLNALKVEIASFNDSGVVVKEFAEILNAVCDRPNSDADFANQMLGIAP
ncbi:hypothetical protein [Brucella pseudogrignonensis]|uniref:hypothetical protein n=1 Tax=Brucella pseudogrignonensis TaxID=419475 RepID=UPI000CFD3789|nr:hypothetical protein [Brucella pseudogrignonensis]MQP42361.1 hypothetical protein [Ochrobactrum sp. MYb237]PQZ44057.1 hypothetical protein CQ059_09315 [Brucella pseudogrignonensis]PRA38303.1 hypothetical protein CQ063_19190 [Brucella pseudogrignonensis]PRA64146.1 hypothetical protein CQ055_19080 [Brucella pseudogrignonensis]